MKKKILVIEDEKSINYLICTVLTANQYDAIPAYSDRRPAPCSRPIART